MDMTRVYASDWEGIYANGGLVMEGHSIDAGQCLIWLAKRMAHVSSYNEVEACDDWLSDRGDLPQDLSSVVIAGATP